MAVWDSETGERVKRLKGHTSFVNSCYPARRGPQLVCTGSDDGTVKVNVFPGEKAEGKKSGRVFGIFPFNWAGLSLLLLVSLS